MSFAPYHNDAIPADAGRLMGRFNTVKTGVTFEFASRTQADLLTFAPEFPNRIFVGPNGDETRCARVMKTVAYVVVDEAADGSPVVEKWAIGAHKLYA